jgi:hypothetical protein
MTVRGLQGQKQKFSRNHHDPIIFIEGMSKRIHQKIN